MTTSNFSKYEGAPRCIRRCLKICGWLTFVLLLGLQISRAHVVTQLYAEWKPQDSWYMEIWFDAGYAVPEWRGDESTPAPERAWLVNMGEDGWKKLRTEAERYLRGILVLSSDGKEISWQASFPDFDTDPPDFPVLMNGGAYFRIRIHSDQALSGSTIARWADGDHPSLVLKMPGDKATYLTFAPGQYHELHKSGRVHWIETFRQGFLHVLPHGLDHILFVIGLFFYRRQWRPLVMQSLAFTAAHTVTLGLAAAGWIRVSGNWVEPVIALSLVAVAVENFRERKESSPWLRLAIVFVFGLIHGLGFAGALSAWLHPGNGFITALISANIGVEVAQVFLLAVAWLITCGWSHTIAFRWSRIAVCLAIAGIGGFWVLERTGIIG